MNNTSWSWPLSKKSLPQPSSKKIIISSPPGSYMFFRRVIDPEMGMEYGWEGLWKKILTQDGRINLNQLKKELFDYSFLIQEAARVYHYVSGGRVFKPSQTSDEVIAAFNEYFKDKVNEEVKKRLSSH